MFTDNHNHTKHYSSDAVMTINELIEGCKSRNIKQIAITEHYDMNYPHPEDMVFDIDKYSSEFNNWKVLSQESNGPKLLMGIEFGFQNGLANDIDRIASSYAFDCVLLSNHIFRGVDVYFYKDNDGLSRKEKYKEYIATMAQMAEEVTNYDIVTHFDYIDRYTKDMSSGIFYEDCPNEFDKLFEVLIAKDKSLEINTRSIEARRNRKPELLMPDSNIIKRYVSMGGKLISLGSDSHSPNTLGINFKETTQYLKTLGVNEVVYYKNRKPYFESID